MYICWRNDKSAWRSRSLDYLISFNVFVMTHLSLKRFCSKSSLEGIKKLLASFILSYSDLGHGGFAFNSFEIGIYRCCVEIRNVLLKIAPHVTAVVASHGYRIWSACFETRNTSLSICRICRFSACSQVFFFQFLFHPALTRFHDESFNRSVRTLITQRPEITCLHGRNIQIVIRLAVFLHGTALTSFRRWIHCWICYRGLLSINES